MKNIKVTVEKVAPSKGVIPDVLKNQFEWRNTGKFLGENVIAIGDVQEPFWWNRPLKSDTLIKTEPDSLCSCNLPYIKHEASFKTGYNILVNKNSVPVTAHIKIDASWTPDDLQKARTMAADTICSTLVKLGADGSKLKKIGNDVLYENKKFMGNEYALENGVLSEDLVITLEYSPEKDIFKRLTGKYALCRGITGIIEETGRIFTKEQFIAELKNELESAISELS